MTAYYEEIMELWKAGNFVDAIRSFSRWIPKGLVSEEEIRSFNRELAEFWQLVEAECGKNPEAVFALYEMLRKAKNWDDERLCEELEISSKTLEHIKRRHKTKL